MIEKDIEREVVRMADALGGFAVKLKDDQRGFPDRTLLLPNATIVFAELKLPGRNKRYKMQEIWIERLQRLGFAAAFCETVEEVQDLCSKADIRQKPSKSPSIRTRKKR